MGFNPFAGCNGLEQIIVDSGNTVYDSRDNCNAIIKTSTNKMVVGCKNSVVPNTVTSIGEAFYRCSSLISIFIPNSVTTIEYDAFWGCSSLNSINIGNSVTSIGEYAFYRCSCLNSMTVCAETPPVLDDGIFNSVNKFIPVYVPVGTISAYQAAWGWSEFTNYIEMCQGTIAVEVSPMEGGIVSGGGIYQPGQSCTVSATPAYGYTFSNWTQNGLIASSQAEYTFYVTGNTVLVAHFVPEGNIVFADVNVKNICVSHWDTNGDGELSYVEAALVTSLGNVFMFNTEITSFEELQYFINLTSINSSAFYGCNGLTGNLTIPNSVTTIGDGAFYNCSGFTGSLTIPNSVTTIGNSAFSSCSGFTGSLTIPNSVTSIGMNAFSSCSGFTGSLTIPNSVTTIGHSAFYNCSGFTGSLTIPNSVTTIGEFAFEGCSGFTGSLTIPNSVTSLGTQTFAGCSGFTGSLTIPNSVTTIGFCAFIGCSGLTGSLTIPNSVTTIGLGAFSGCSGLTGSLTIPNSVTSIGVNAFDGCRFTGSLIIPNSITTIEGGTFNMCWNFTSVEIPETVTFIGVRAFACWYGLQSMTVLANTPPTLENYAFANVNKFIPVYVPCGSLSAYQNAEGWNEFTNIQEACDIFTVTATANPAEGGSVIGGGSYTQGTTCTLTATANEGYSFVNWTENNEVVSTNANYSFTVSGNRNLVANFALSGTITNHWTPESANYSEIMAMYSVIQIDGVEQYSNTLEVGVFCGDECRGSAIASEFNLTHRYLAVLNVFGENGHQLSFKLYDHSIGQELNLTSPATVTFDVNGYGNPVEPYVLNFTSSITHSQALNSGWNWWSTYIEQEGIDGLGMLENSIGSSGVRIQGRNGTIDQFEYQGSSYWYGSLSSIENEQMYKIRTNAACNAVMVGHAASPANHPININGGWNWIGFPCNQSVSVNDALSGFTPVANDVIKSRNGSTTYVSYGSTSLWYGTLNTLEPGQGYMYKSNSNTSKTLVFQTGRGEETVTDVTKENSFFTPNTDDFSDNMLVTAVIDMDGQELRSEDYEVAAYVGNECRGSVRLMYVEPFDRYVAFLLVFGEAEEEIHFVLTDGNDVVLSDDFLTYTADGLVGTLTEPATLHFGALGLNDNEHDFVNVFPNPSNGVFNIEGNGIHKIEVVNAFGQAILLKEVENNLMQIDLGDKAAGVYLLRVITNNGITTKQLVKE